MFGYVLAQVPLAASRAWKSGERGRCALLVLALVVPVLMAGLLAYFMPDPLLAMLAMTPAIAMLIWSFFALIIGQNRPFHDEPALDGILTAVFAIVAGALSRELVIQEMALTTFLLQCMVMVAQVCAHFFAQKEEETKKEEK